MTMVVHLLLLPSSDICKFCATQQSPGSVKECEKFLSVILIITDMYQNNCVSQGMGRCDVEVQALTGSTLLVKALRGRCAYASKLMLLPELFLYSKYVFAISLRA